jgi:hypothetical protein
MKTKIFFLSLFLHLICFYGNTQAYNPLVLENAQWKVIWDIDPTPWIDGQGGWLIRGDTLMNEIQYKKLFQRSFEEPYSNVIINQLLYGFVREDTLNRIVYILESGNGGCDTSDQEYVLFDFSYEIGDTSEMCLHTEEVESFLLDITQDYIFGANRRIFHFGSSASFIEGIGHEYGLLESPIPIVNGSRETFLMDYCVGTDEHCNMVYVKIDEKEHIPHYQVYPNPCRGYFFIQDISDLNEDVIFTVNDVIGKEVVSGEIPENSKFQINLKEPGLYFLQIRRQGETLSCYKVFNR